MLQKLCSALLFIFIFAGLALAQEEETVDEFVLRMIEETRLYEATQLDLSNFNIRELPAEIGSLENLRALHLSGNQLSQLPVEIANLSNLTYLDLSDNQFSKVPSEIAQLSNLANLRLRDNQLSQLPIFIGNLDKLQWLDLSENNLITLPAEIGNLTKLCYLDLSNNELQFLPSELGQITELATATNCERGFYGLFLDGNPLISPPPEVIAEGTPAILEYLRNEAWWHFQRLVLGGLSFAGILAGAVLGLRWKNRQGKAKRKNQENV